MAKSSDGIANRPLPREFYDRAPADVARELLGMRLFRLVAKQLTVGLIVETEAYLASGDSASHAHRGETRRNASMFGDPGHAYVYSIHARFCFNAVTEPKGVASAVLVRAVEPLTGTDVMVKRRSADVSRNLTRGPARLCEAFAIDRSLDGWDLTLGRGLWIADAASRHKPRISQSARVGVTSSKDLALRFFIEESRYVSRFVSRP
jgi:DNA-3-methyladenine glycosylase